MPDRRGFLWSLLAVPLAPWASRFQTGLVTPAFKKAVCVSFGSSVLKPGDIVTYAWSDEVHVVTAEDVITAGGVFRTTKKHSR